MNFKHYIFTRFNLGLYSDNPYNIKNPDKWMDTRIKLFEQTAFPSIIKQTNKDFTWLMAFDVNTPERYTKLYDYCDCIKVCFEQPHLYLKEQPPEADWIITSRLDNDDIYEPTFVEEIQKKAIELQKTVEGIELGYIIDIEYNKTDLNYVTIMSGRKGCNGPFLSFVEKWGKDVTTALGYKHSEFTAHFPHTKITTPLAQQVIHKDNVINSF